MKRGYSREFKPHGNTGKRYLLDDIPAGLWAEVRARAKREGVSVRALILSLLQRWVGRGPDQTVAGADAGVAESFKR
jgi:hypothetical protein